MPAITYVEETEPDVQARVRARFDRDINTLATLGFRELCFYREQRKEHITSGRPA
jgi:hypothetical protein